MEIPIVFITGHGDIAMAVRAVKAGAVDFLTKPFNNQDLLDAVFAALERDRARRTQRGIDLDVARTLQRCSASAKKRCCRMWPPDG